MNNLPKHHGAGPTEARGPMQLHRLHRLKAGPGTEDQTFSSFVHVQIVPIRATFRCRPNVQIKRSFCRSSVQNIVHFCRSSVHFFSYIDEILLGAYGVQTLIWRAFSRCSYSGGCSFFCCSLQENE